MTKAEQAKIYSAYGELEQACMAFGQALAKFQKVYNPTTVGLTELSDEVYQFLEDVDSELDGVL
jgi:hypothetical protein